MRFIILFLCVCLAKAGSSLLHAGFSLVEASRVGWLEGGVQPLCCDAPASLGFTE